MKNKHLLTSFVALFLIACGKETTDAPMLPEVADYVGTVSVRYNAEPFDNEGIHVNFTPAEDGQTASITLHQIRFVPQMPVTIDVTIPGIVLLKGKDKISLSCEKCIPLAMGGEYPKYTVTDLRGEIVGDELAFSLNFGDYPTSFKGRIEKVNER